MKGLLFKLYIKFIELISGKGLNKILPTQKIYFFVSQLLKPQKIKVQNHWFYIDQKKSGVYLAHHFISKKEYEPITTNVFKYFLKPEMTAIDIGAHLGYFTLLAARLVGSNGKVFAFEPEPYIYSLLKKNIEINGYNNILTTRQAVTNIERELTLYLSSESSGSNSIYPGTHYDKITHIPTISLDIFFKNDLNKDFIKMDIEGAEPLALAGMTKLIQNNRKLILISEFNPSAIKKSGDNPINFINDLYFHFPILFAIDEIKKRVIPIKNKNYFDSILNIKNYWNNILCVKGYDFSELKKLNNI